MTRLQAVVLWTLVVAVVIGLAGGAKLWVGQSEQGDNNCQAINETRGPLVEILKSSRDLSRPLDASGRIFYRDSIAALAPLDCG